MTSRLQRQFRQYAATPDRRLDTDGNTALHLAALSGDIDAAQDILAARASVHLKNNNGDTPLLIATARGDEPMMRLLLSHDRSGISMAGTQGAPLHLAAQNGDTAAVNALLDFGADINVPDPDGTTPLMMAMFQKQHAVVDLLLTRGANVGATRSNGETALHLAALDNDALTLEKLLTHGGADAINKRTDNHKHTALHTAARAGAEDAARVLLAFGADANVPDSQAMTALHTATTRGDVAMIFLLVALGHADINKVVNPTGYTPLHTAIFDDKPDALRLLIALGADPHQSDAEGRTPLHLAGWKGNLPILRYLMEDIAPHPETDAQSRVQALYDALIYDHAAVADYLIAPGKMDFNRPTTAGEYVLQAALQGGRSDRAEKLLDAGAQANVQNRQGSTPIFLCASRNMVVAATLLLSRGASADVKTGHDTPLHAAVGGDYPFMVEILLKAGANPLAPDQYGRNPLDLARQKGRAHMVPVLETAIQDYGQRKNPKPFQSPKPS